MGELAAPRPRLYTIGHGTLPIEEFLAVLDGVGVRCLVDIRSYPGSRRNPQFGQEAMEVSVPAAGIEYRWLRALGGRRRPSPHSRHLALRHEAFRAYADHMESDEFRGGVAELLRAAAAMPTAVMCSESVWWRCHRRLLADHLVLVEGVEVIDLMHDGRHVEHRVTEGARREGDDVVYDDGAPGLFGAG